MSYRQSDHDFLEELDELDEEAIQGTQESVSEDIELIKQALDSSEFAYEIRKRENEGENDELLNHLRNIRGSLVAYLRNQEE